ncbi:MAG: sigma 54-interacting transcriptional regulator [Clostridia bacterium]|nr:sigma 54-interacting transcriptional regulator [Clostridia bacterium]
MVHIDFALPSPTMIPFVKQAWSMHNEVFGPNLYGLDYRYTVECEVSPTIILAKHFKADVVVSRGGTASTIRNQNPMTPIVEIPITANDLRISIRQAVERYGDMAIGVVGTANMTCCVDYLGAEYPFPVMAFTTPDIVRDSLREGVREAVQNGAKMIIGGYHTMEFAKEYGVPSGLLISSAESIFLAITEAKRCAQVFLAERESSATNRAVLNHVSDGVIAVDQNGIVRAFNPVAEMLLGRKSSEMIGRPTEKVLPEGNLLNLLSYNKPFHDEVVRIGGEYIRMSGSSMTDADRQLGTVITMRKVRESNVVSGNMPTVRNEKSNKAKYHFRDILGESTVLQDMIHQARQYAKVDSNILLFGETGTGKELVAQSIHNESERADRPFVAVNCAAISPSLFESELFGYVGGAFTGANKNGKAGFFESAHTGTIFLDEISEIPLEMQTRLLRIIQEREVRRIGSDKVIDVDVRIICATNKDLTQLIAENKFREDLYYRLKVLSINLPPLRRRDGDAALIMQHYLNYYAAKFGKT